MYEFKGLGIVVPSELKELNYEDFLKYIALKTDLEKLELFKGESLADLKATESQMAGVLANLSYFDEMIVKYIKGDRDVQDNETIEVLGKQLKFTKQLGQLPYWPMTKVKDVIKQMGKEPFNDYEHYADVVGHYLYSKYAPYDEYKAEEFITDVVMKMPFTDVIRLGDFFLYIQRRSWNSKLKVSQPIFQRMKKMLA